MLINSHLTMKSMTEANKQLLAHQLTFDNEIHDRSKQATNCSSTLI